MQGAGVGFGGSHFRCAGLGAPSEEPLFTPRPEANRSLRASLEEALSGREESVHAGCGERAWPRIRTPLNGGHGGIILTPTGGTGRS